MGRHGDGSIHYDRQRKRYEVVLSLGYVTDPETGKRKRRRLKRHVRGTLADAKRALREMRDEVEGGVEAKGSGVALERYLLDEIGRAEEIGRIRFSTAERERCTLRNQVSPHLAGAPLHDVTTRRLRDFFARLTKDGVSDKNQLLTYILLRKYLGQASDHGLIRDNPVKRSMRPAYKPEPATPWSPDEARRFVSWVREHAEYPWRAMLLTLSLSGIRFGELAGLTWEALNLDEREAHVRQTLVKAGKDARFGEPKSARGNRFLALHGELVRELKRHRSLQVDAGLPVTGPEGLVFRGPRGRALQNSSLRRVFRASCAEAGVTTIRLHDIRHTAATLLIAEGVPVDVVSRMLGHASFAFTVDTYVHGVRGEGHAAIDKLGKALGGR